MGKIGSSRIIAFVAFGLAFSSATWCQSIPDSLASNVEEAVESALENTTRDIEDSQVAESLLQLSVNPIDLNTATANDLQQIPGLDPLLASRIVSYRKKHGFSSVDELVHVEGLDRSMFQQIRGFLMVSMRSNRHKATDDVAIHYTGRTIRRLQDQRGYVDGTFLGNPYRIYNKFLAQYAVDSGFLVEAGGLTEKDPGEEDVSDFATGFIGISNASKSVRCIVGDYTVEGGQGLALWRSTGATKGNEVISSISKNQRGLQPYRSSDENGFLRGVAVEARLGLIDITGFVSRKPINANLNEGGYITSFNTSGLSRTQSESQSKSSSGETMLGMNVDTWLFEGFRMGIRACTTHYDHPIALSGINGFSGRKASIESIDFSYASSTLGSFGEAAMDRDNSTAMIGGIVLEPVSVLDVALVVRSYPQRFVSMHGFGFGESGGQPRNEKGVYASARLSLFAWLTISSYYDQFATMGPSTVSLLPTAGHEFLSAVRLQWGEQSSVQFKVKQKNQAAEELLLDEFSRTNSIVGKRTQANYRASFEWIPSSFIRWKARFERVSVKYHPSGIAQTGFLVYQDVQVRLKRRLSIDGRVIVFDTDSYDSRIYEYESELHGTFANPALFGKGIRMYILMKYPMGALEFSIKYSTTLKPGMKSIGSGLNEIQGDTDDQLGFQVDLTI
jgi:hypothetical protein